MKDKRFTYLMFLFASILVMLVNLGSHHLFVHTDEPRRTLVALELLFSGNWFYPTINGEAYLNKPAVFNWMIIGLYKLFGTYDEWASRLVTVIFGVLCSLGIYQYLREKYTEAAAQFVALAFIVNARFLFYDSFLGMMDLPFAFFSLGSFYFLYRKEKSASFSDICLSYCFAAMAFLLKGLPGIYFQFVNVLVYFIVRKNLRHHSLTKHIVAGFLALGVIASYYIGFFETSQVDPQQYFANLFNESSKRTVVRFGVFNTLKHLMYFPLDSIVNFAPWTLGLFGFFSSRVRRRVFAVKENKTLLLIILLQLAPYWTSPEVSPRYLYCVVPFVFLFSFEGMQAFHSISKTKLWKNITLLPLMFCLVGFSFAAQFIELAPIITSTSLPLFALLTLAGLGLSLHIPRSKLSFAYLFMAVLIYARLSYDLHLLPKRAIEHIPLKKDANDVARMTKGSSLCLYKGTWLQDGSSFYITKGREKILRRCGRDNSDGYMLVDKEYLKELNGETVLEISTRYKTSPVSLIKVKRGVM